MAKKSGVANDFLIEGDLEITGIFALGEANTIGTSRTVQAIGTETNIDIELISKGIGTVKVYAGYENNVDADEDLINYGFHKTHLIGKPASSLLQAPTVLEDQFAVVWDFASGEYTLADLGLTTTYENGITKDGTVVKLGTDLTENTEIGGNFTFNLGLDGNKINTFNVRASTAVDIRGVGNTKLNFFGTHSVQLIGGSVSSYIIINDDGAPILRDNIVGAQQRGLRGYADYSANVTDNDYIQKIYADNRIGGKNVSALVKAPTVTEHNFVLSWDNTNNRYNLREVSGGGGGGHDIYNGVDVSPLTTRTNLRFSNGLTASDNDPDTDVKWGGVLTAHTTIEGVYDINFGKSDGSLNIPNTSFFTDYFTIVADANTYTDYIEFSTGGFTSYNTLNNRFYTADLLGQGKVEIFEDTVNIGTTVSGRTASISLSTNVGGLSYYIVGISDNNISFTESSQYSTGSTSAIWSKRLDNITAPSLVEESWSLLDVTGRFTYLLNFQSVIPGYEQTVATLKGTSGYYAYQSMDTVYGSYSVHEGNQVSPLIHTGLYRSKSTRIAKINLYTDTTEQSLELRTSNGGSITYLKLSTNNSAVIFGTSGFQGIRYDSDYSTNYTSRSLIDKGYADATYALASGSFWSLASGGTLTGNNTISGNFNKYFTGTGSFVIGHNAVTGSARLQVRGIGTTTGNLILAEDNAGTERFKILDNGEIYGTLINLFGNTSPYSIRLGYRAGESVTTTNTYSISIGWQSNYNISTVGLGSIALGYQAYTSNQNSISIGVNANFSLTNGTGSIALGAITISTGTSSISIGYLAESKAINEVVIGASSGSTSGTHNSHSVSIGSGANFGTYDIGDSSVAIGRLAVSPSIGSIGIGLQTNNTSGTFGAYAISLGYNANQGTHNIGADSIAIGRATKTTGANTISIGTSVNVETSNSIAIGNGATVNNTGTASVAIGYNSVAQGGALAFGYGAQALSTGDGLALGTFSKASSSTAVGYNASNTSGTIGPGSISLGIEANSGTHNIGTRSIAIGHSNQTTGNYSIAIGGQVLRSTASGSILMGYGNTTLTNSTADSFGLGWGASTSPDILFAKTADMYINNTAGGLALGSNTVTANTKLDIRGKGTTTDKTLRLADSTNTERFYFTDAGNMFIVTAPANDDALTQVLVRDSGTGEIKYRTAASLIGGSSGWALTGTSTLTGVATITSNTANQHVFNGTWTATANNQYHMNFGGSLTARGTLSDTLYGYSFTPTLIAAANSQRLISLTINPTYNTGAFSSVEKIAIHVNDNGTNTFNVLHDGAIMYGAITQNFTSIGTGIYNQIRWNTGNAERIFNLNGSAVFSEKVMSNGRMEWNNINNNTGYIWFEGGTERFRIVNGVSYFSTSLGLGINTGITANTRLDIRGTGTTTNTILRLADSANTERFNVLDNGSISATTNVNVGTPDTAPYKFTVTNGVSASFPDVFTIKKTQTTPNTNTHGMKMNFITNNSAGTLVTPLLIQVELNPTAGNESSSILMYGLSAGSQAALINVGTTVALGLSSNAVGGNSVSLGISSKSGTNSVAIGWNAGNTSGALNSEAISIGYQANYGTYAIGSSSVAIGRQASSKGDNSVMLGNNAGLTNGTMGNNAIGIGSPINNTGNIGAYSIAIGATAASQATGAILLGYRSSGGTLVNSTANSFALGWDSTSPDILFTKTADMYINNTSGGLVLGSNAVTANTKLDIRGLGITTGLALRIADSANTVRFGFQDNGYAFLYTTPQNDNALTQILARDGATGEIKYRSAASLSGGGGYTVTLVTGTTHNETATSGTVIIKCDPTSNNITVNLPTAVGNTATIIIKRVTGGTNTLTVDGSTTETIDGSTTVSMPVDQESITLISDNANWQII